MANVNSTAYQDRICIDEPNGFELDHDSYCEALIGTDGAVIPGSRLSDDFDRLSAAFAALSSLKSRPQNAAVFSSSPMA